jgi:hypothetical protein
LTSWIDGWVPQADVYLVRGDSGRTLMAHGVAKS